MVAIENRDAGQLFDGVRVLLGREFAGEQVEAAGAVCAGNLPPEAEGAGQRIIKNNLSTFGQCRG